MEARLDTPAPATAQFGLSPVADADPRERYDPRQEVHCADGQNESRDRYLAASALYDSQLNK
jgi:hypothetical protein